MQALVWTLWAGSGRAAHPLQVGQGRTQRLIGRAGINRRSWHIGGQWLAMTGRAGAIKAPERTIVSRD